MHARTSGSSGNVRDRLKRSVLSGRLVASGNGDELLRPFGVVPRFRATSRKLFRPKLTFSDRIVSNRTSAFCRPLSSYSMPSFLPFAGPPPRETEGRATDRLDINLRGGSRSERPFLRPRTAALNSAGPSCANGCSASVAARFSRVVSVPGAAHRQWPPRPPHLTRAPRRWGGRARAAAPCSEETSVRAAASLRRTNGPLGAMDNRPGRLHHLRDHGLRGPGGRPRIRRPGNPGDWLGQHGE